MERANGTELEGREDVCRRVPCPVGEVHLGSRIRDEGSRIPLRACSQAAEHAGTAPRRHR